MFFLGIHMAGLDPLGGVLLSHHMRRHRFLRLLGRLLSPEFGAGVLLTAFLLMAPEIAHGEDYTEQSLFASLERAEAATLAVATVKGIEGNMVIVSGGDTYLEGREFVDVVSGQGAGQSFRIVDAMGEVMILSADVSQVLRAGDQLVIRQLPNMKVLAS